MEYKQIQELIKTINKSNISELSIEEGDFKITIKQELSGQAHYVTMPQMPVQMQMPQQAHQQALPAAAPSGQANDKPVFLNIGDEIKAGQVICIIEAMKLFNEIESEISGRIVKVLVDESSPVEYDQPLFVVEPI
jgi:acetyl-CoA carboxylase biotin carboxyl carrier protein